MKKAVAYCRFSSDNQRTESIDAQVRAIEEYCKKEGYILIKIYKDEAISGTSIDDREEFLEMIEDSKNKEFNYVIVHKFDRFARNRYDHAINEKKLNENGVKLISVLEQLNDSPEAVILKSVLTGMNEYYSLNLAREVRKGQKENALKCIHNGGIPPLGYDLTEDKTYTINEEEAKAVRLIFKMYLEGRGYAYIADELNSLGFKNKLGKPFKKISIRDTLYNEKYIGNNIYNKTSSKLKSRLVKNPKNEWVRCDKAYKPIISKKKYNKAQEIIQLRSVHLTNEELLEKLKQKLESNGKLSGFIIDEDDTGPSSSVYRTRFGGLLRAYTLIGYKPEHDYSYIQINEALRSFYSGIIEDFKGEILKSNCYIDEYKYAPMLYINDEFLISVLITKCTHMKSGKLRWKVRFDNSQKADITIVIRMDSQNISPLDFYIIPKIENEYSKMWMTETNNIRLDLYRFDNLDKLLQIITRMKVRELYAA